MYGYQEYNLEIAIEYIDQVLEFYSQYSGKLIYFFYTDALKLKADLLIKLNQEYK